MQPVHTQTESFKFTGKLYDYFEFTLLERHEDCVMC